MTFTTAISKTRDKLDQIIGVQKDPYVDLALRARLVLGWILSCAHFISDLYLNWFMRGFTTTADNYSQNTQNPDRLRKTTEPLLINAKGQILPAVAMGDVINYHMC